MKRLSAKELREYQPTQTELLSLKRHQLYFILDNVLDTYNIGGIFRLADAVAAKEIFLCGLTNTPPDPKIHRAAIGTEKLVQWSYFKNTKSAVSKLKKSNVKVVALEQGVGGVNYLNYNFKLPLALIVGSEQYGIDRDILNICDSVIELPMYGFNKSLNVIVSLAIVAYKALENLA